MYCKFNYTVVANKTIHIEIPARKVISEWPRLVLDDGSIDPNGFLDKRSVCSGTFNISLKESEDDTAMSISGCPLHRNTANYDLVWYQEYGISEDDMDAIVVEHEKKADAMN